MRQQSLWAGGGNRADVVTSLTWTAGALGLSQAESRGRWRALCANGEESAGLPAATETSAPDRVERRCACVTFDWHGSDLTVPCLWCHLISPSNAISYVALVMYLTIYSLQQQNYSVFKQWRAVVELSPHGGAKGTSKQLNQWAKDGRLRRWFTLLGENKWSILSKVIVVMYSS